MSKYAQYHDFRSRLNCRILGTETARGQTPDGSPNVGGTLVTKRFFALDGQAYQDGALPARTKELMGLVASMVLRCDDCVAYHIDQCLGLGVTDQELFESFDVALIVGGSIVIPHLRRAVDFLDSARAARAAGDTPTCPAT